MSTHRTTLANRLTEIVRRLPEQRVEELNKLDDNELFALLWGRPLDQRFFVVDDIYYDSDRWKDIDKSDYVYVNPNITPDHFPIERRGKGTVWMTYLPEFDHKPTTKEVLDAFEHPGIRLRRPSRAECETFVKQHPEEEDTYAVIGFCGKVMLGFLVYFDADEHGRDLHLSHLGDYWYRDCRFLAVIEEEDEQVTHE